MSKRLEHWLHDGNIDAISKLQRFTYRCLNMFGPVEDKNYNIERKKEFMDIWAKKLFKDYDYSITFDETIWYPVQPDLYGNVVVIKLWGNPNAFIHKINFNEDDNDIFHIDWKLNYLQKNDKV
jgi:hypothetical protein